MLRKSVSKRGGQQSSALRAPSDSSSDKPRTMRGKRAVAVINVGNPSARGGRKRWGGGREISRAGRKVTLSRQLSPILTAASKPMSWRNDWLAARKARKLVI